MIARALTIAGSDSGGGAGIQADLKTFAALRVYGTSAVTAVTAQNTMEVAATHVIPPEFVRRQIEAVVTDIGCDAAKTGMLATAATVTAVARAVRDLRIAPLVVDPVIASDRGDSLLADSPEVALDALLRELVPLATVITPNVPEAEKLTGMPIHSVADMRRAARWLLDRGAQACLVKGGHLPGETATDVLATGSTIRELVARRVPSRHTHGTGCQLSAAIAAHLALGHGLDSAVDRGKRFVTVAIAGGLALGHGRGPANPLAWVSERGQGGRAND